MSVHVERPHESIPGVTVGDLGGPMHELVKLIANTLKETGDVLQRSGYPDLGTFVLEALNNGEKAGAAKGGVDADVVLEQIVKAIPGFRDMALVNGHRKLSVSNCPCAHDDVCYAAVYVFKKALFLIHAIKIRFGSASPPKVPIPDTSGFPVFSDNVLPSMLAHLGVIDLSTASSGLDSIFPVSPQELESLLASGESYRSKDIVAALPKGPPKDGPSLTHKQAYILRAAAIDACEQIVEVAHTLEGAPEWLRTMTLPDLDIWIWAVAKDRRDYRQLPRFALRNTIMF